MNQEETITRRTFFKRGLQFWLSGLFLASSVYAYARYVEPNRLEITNVALSSAKIPSSFHHKKIILFSDVHLGHGYTLSDLKNLVVKINNLEPDIVVFAGDLIDDPLTYGNTGEIAPILSNIRASLGRFAIYGNHDHGGYGTERYKKVMKDAGFRLLINESVQIQGDDGYIVVAGIDDVLFGRHNPKKALSSLSKQTFTILLAHEPDIADGMTNFPVDIQLSGHSHGGQIQAPFFGPVVTSALAKKYVEGLYDIGTEGMQLYVSRGIGTTGMPLRFLCNPELTVITLKSE